MIPRHNGDRASPSPGAPFHAPRAPLSPALSFQVLFLPLLLYRISLVGRVACGVAAILSSVISVGLPAVAKWRGVPSKAGAIIGFSDLPGVRALIKIYGVGVLW